MNRIILADLIEHLESIEPDEFTMDQWLASPLVSELRDPDDPHLRIECGTVGCIAGHLGALHLSKARLYNVYHDNTFIDLGVELLGLDRDVVNDLFMGYWTNRQQEDVTVDMAIDQLKRLLMTGHTVYFQDDDYESWVNSSSDKPCPEPDYYVVEKDLP